MSAFSRFALDESILSALEKMDYQNPTPIQEKVIPPILEKHNVLALAETGSGKTAACGIPVVQKIDVEKKVPQALILVPTRELALQYAQELQKIGKEKKVVVFGILGGESMELQKAKLEHGVHILVATPGRLIDMIYEQHIPMGHLHTVILDEADKMLSMGFIDDVSFILDCVVQEYQFLLFSATMASELEKVMQKYLKEHKTFFLNQNKKGPEKLKHLQYFCAPHDKLKALEKLIADKKPQQSMIFCASRIECERVYRSLKPRVDSVDYLHGGLSQNLRTTIAQKYDKGKIRHLVVTDIAGRGLDFKGITHVFVYTLTRDEDAYVHKSGRTARSNREGECITLLTSKELRIMEKILKKLDKQPDWIQPPKDFKSRPDHQKKEGQKKTKSFSRKKTQNSESPPAKPRSINKELLTPPPFRPNLGKES